MRGFKSFAEAECFCRSYDELRNSSASAAATTNLSPPIATAFFTSIVL
jgi:hypothetical protein